MDFDIVPFEVKHIESAARLVSARYRQLCGKVPALPARYADASTLSELLADLLKTGSGAAAIREGSLIGFITAWQLASLLGKPGSFSPEWANTVAGTDGRHVYEALYTHLAPTWRAHRFDSHWISLLADDAAGLECWQWLGFGMVAADAVRSLAPVSRADSNEGGIRQAGPRDLETVLSLDRALFRHIAGPPIYLIDDEWPTRAEYEAWLHDPQVAVWIAEATEEAIGFLTIGPEVQDACTIIRDEGTASVIAAFTREEVRGKGVATGLLNRALTWAKDHGYERCAVDFEPMNPPARRFWTRHFDPVAYTVVRYTGAFEGKDGGPGTGDG